MKVLRRFSFLSTKGYLGLVHENGQTKKRETFHNRICFFQSQETYCGRKLDRISLFFFWFLFCVLLSETVVTGRRSECRRVFYARRFRTGLGMRMRSVRDKPRSVSISPLSSSDRSLLINRNAINKSVVLSGVGRPLGSEEGGRGGGQGG